MKSEGCNGWSNYETWVVKLWLDNEEGSYHYWREQTQELWFSTRQDKDDTIRELAQQLKSEHESNTPETVGVYADLLNAALAEVDWHEIAESLFDAEEFEEETEEATESGD